jgi:REP element-mobilizing transposase RayT
MTRSRYKIFDNAFPHFLTCTVVGWLPIFTRPDAVQIIFDSWLFLHKSDRLQIFGYVILENHLHLIASSTQLAKEIGDFKSFTARKIIDLLKARKEAMVLEQLAWHKEEHKTDRDFQLWQESSHPEQIQSDEMMWQKLEYMHDNPLKRGYVACPEHWRYSSAMNYLGQPGVFPVCTQWR